LDFSGEILTYQMRTLSDNLLGVTKGGTLTKKKKKKDIVDGGPDGRIQ
jgi:hypothetical protein